MPEIHPQLAVEPGRALEVAGVEFIDENAGGPGVRLRERQQQKTWVLKITLSSAQFRVTVRI